MYLPFPNRSEGGEAADENRSRYHQNPDGIGFLFKFDPFSSQHWGLSVFFFYLPLAAGGVKQIPLCIKCIMYMHTDGVGGVLVISFEEKLHV